jgi:hypothetical protein
MVPGHRGRAGRGFRGRGCLAVAASKSSGLSPTLQRSHCPRPHPLRYVYGHALGRKIGEAPIFVDKVPSGNLSPSGRLSWHDR